MREADFTPTPGKRRSAWIKTSSELVLDMKTDEEQKKYRGVASARQARRGWRETGMDSLSMRIARRDPQRRITLAQ